MTNKKWKEVLLFLWDSSYKSSILWNYEIQSELSWRVLRSITEQNQRERDKTTKLLFFFLFSKFFFYCLYLWNKFSHFSRRFGYQCHRRIRPQDLGEEEQEAFALVINLIWFLKIHNWYQLSLTDVVMGDINKETLFFFVHEDKTAAQFFLVFTFNNSSWKSPSEFTQPLHTAHIQS